MEQAKVIAFSLDGKTATQIWNKLRKIERNTKKPHQPQSEESPHQPQHEEPPRQPQLEEAQHQPQHEEPPRQPQLEETPHANHQSEEEELISNNLLDKVVLSLVGLDNLVKVNNNQSTVVRWSTCSIDTSISTSNKESEDKNKKGNMVTDQNPVDPDSLSKQRPKYDNHG